MSGPEALITDDLYRHARERPDERAVVQVSGDGEARELSWGALASQVDRTAAMLLSLGVRAGEPVAFQLPNRLEFVTVALATLRIGAVCEPLMPIFRERELEFMLRASGARTLFVPGCFRGRDHLAMAIGLRSALDELEHVVLVGNARGSEAAGYDELVADYEELVARARPDPGVLAARRPTADQTAQLLFTSGTSGEPKGVLHRHDVLTRAADAHIRHFDLRGDDVVYVPSPLAHQTGFLYGMWIALRLGVPQVLQETWDPLIGHVSMQRFGVTFVQAATPFLADLTRIARDEGEEPSALRTFVATGAAIPRDLAREARDVLRAEVGGAWGTTESCLGTGFAPGDPPELAWSTDGRPLEGVEVRVVDDEGAELGPEVEGNFEVRTRCLFDGYLNRPEATAEVLTNDGFYRTGDLARIDRHGYVRITGRVKDVVNRGGEKIPVAEIEQVLYTHPAVRDAAIVAMPDRRLGERACAFVVLAPGAELDFAGMQDHLDEYRVSKTYWPERLELVTRLPTTPSGKIQKYVLRERARQLAERKAIPT